MPAIIEMGGAEYAKIGTEGSTGTKLISVSGDVQRPGNYEIPLGILQPRDHLRTLRWPQGGARGQDVVPRRLELAGAAGKEDLDTPVRLRLDGQGRFDARLRCDHRRRRLATPRSRSPSKVTKFYAHESCGKCVPCREGTNWTH